MFSRFKGFSLTELLIALAITGVLIFLCYPSYQAQITKTRRTEGQSALLSLANQIELYYAQHDTYARATIGQDQSTDLISKALTNEEHYTLMIAHADATSYTLFAIPNGQHGMHDKRCQTLTINQLGSKGITSGPLGLPTGSPVECW